MTLRLKRSAGGGIAEAEDRLNGLARLAAKLPDRVRVAADGYSIRYQGSMHVGVWVERACLANLGGTAEVIKLLSLSLGIKAFFVTQN